jgi:hypothetical protein
MSTKIEEVRAVLDKYYPFTNVYTGDRGHRDQLAAEIDALYASKRGRDVEVKALSGVLWSFKQGAMGAIYALAQEIVGVARAEALRAIDARVGVRNAKSFSEGYEYAVKEDAAPITEAQAIAALEACGWKRGKIETTLYDQTDTRMMLVQPAQVAP